MGIHTPMQRDIVYHNIAATHIACDTEGMLHKDMLHGNCIIFDKFLARFWLFSASDCVIIWDYRHLEESLFTLIKIVNEVQKKLGEIFEEIEWSFEKDTLVKKKKKSKLILKNIILVSIQ